MDGDNKKIIDELFLFAKENMDSRKVYPYVSFIVKEGNIISKGSNQEAETFDLTNQDEVVSIRAAQRSLDTGSLAGYSLYSFFEPTMLAFDVALWSGVTDFHWCINSTSYPSSYNQMNYHVADYAKDHPGKITIQSGIQETEALQLVKEAEEKGYRI